MASLKLKAKNQHGTMVDFTQATIMMDQQILNEVCATPGHKGVQDFYDRYCKLHKKRHGEEFITESIDFGPRRKRR